ncbi:hypothetical protein PHBOTO_001313 [Pseudozyma hubeiensis]|nr:hypothetical protein PHBOTO_001313 [Pseudozyma hubeiensis]
MIDPYHLYMGARRSSVRQTSDSKASNTASKQPDASASATTSKNSSVDSRSQQSSYLGGDNLSPTSTISTDQAAKASLAPSGSPSSAASLPHRLPEFDHFRQSSPLMPEFYPRTSEFFSQGRRRSSIAVSPETSAASASLAAVVSPAPAIQEASIPPSRTSVGGSGSGSVSGGSNVTKKADSFHLPLTFEEPESLLGEQLPVRLGLAPPSHSHGLSATDITYKARVGHGYYFFTPPPAPRPPPTSKTSLRPSLLRRNTDTSDKSGLSLNTRVSSTTPLHSSPSSISPSTAATSPQRARANSYITSLPAPTLVGQAKSSKTSPSSSRTRLPPPSPDCWDPEAYFTRTRSRVKGKMREFVYHAFPLSTVPYWHGYSNETIEAETTTHLNVNAALHGNTLRRFPEGSRPARVLDLGCGRGVWCIDMAREWKSSELIGLDVVPIQPPMHQLADADLEHRVSWVVANFLEPLPFPDASFDYVHMRFVHQAVPEDKWVDVFSEVRRILAPGGVFELVEGNHCFFGHASLIDVQELKDLEHGRTATKVGVGVKMPKRLKVLNNGSDSTDIDAIEVVLERMMQRRFINPTPLSVIPSSLLLPGFSNIATGNPRHIPVYAESSAQRARARAAAAASGNEAGSSSANATSSEDETNLQEKYTSRSQIGAPLKSGFAMTDQDLFSAFTILQQLDHFSSSRELVWAEAEEEKRSLQGVPQPPLAPMDSSRRFGQGNPAALKPFAHPWKSKDEFFRAIDAWIDSTKASADLEHMLRKYLGWEQAHDDLTVEGRKYAERRRKMSVSSAAFPSLGLDQLAMDEAADKADVGGRQDSLAASRDARSSVASPESGSKFAVSTTHAHEAPARLQTTRLSAPDTRAGMQTDAQEADATGKAVDNGKKKKKLSKRPSSSGGVGSSVGSVGGLGGGTFGRARTFGRGGAAATIPMPLPDAPAFMAGHAFGPSATDSMFRGPATKAAIVASSRGGAGAIMPLGGRKTSVGSKSFSDKSSISGKTEREDAKSQILDSGASKMTALQAMRPAPVTEEPSPAAAYAATQRGSHGLDEEYRLQSDRVPGRRSSRGVSPTSGIPSSSVPAPGGADVPSETNTRSMSSGATLGRTSIGAPQADSRSVSMPSTIVAGQAGSGGGSVRIAEPTVRPSRGRSASKSNDKAVAMIGFYDTTGFIAIA